MKGLRTTFKSLGIDQTVSANTSLLADGFCGTYNKGTHYLSTNTGGFFDSIYLASYLEQLCCAFPKRQ